MLAWECCPLPRLVAVAQWFTLPADLHSRVHALSALTIAQPSLRPRLQITTRSKLSSVSWNSYVKSQVRGGQGRPTVPVQASAAGCQPRASLLASPSPVCSPAAPPRLLPASLALPDAALTASTSPLLSPRCAAAHQRLLRADPAVGRHHSGRGGAV